MSAKKILLVAGNNSLSHVAKCLALRQVLQDRGCEVLVAVGRANTDFLRRLGVEHTLLPDIQEVDGAGLPTVEWFRDPSRFGACLEAERDLLARCRPDLALGVFRFTLPSAARLAGIPCHSLTCGCMLPGTGEVLGFAEGEGGRNSQKIVLDGFYAYAGARVSRELTRLGLPPVTDVRSLLLGERTMLWDFPLFCPAPELPGVVHVGPLDWEGWPSDPLPEAESSPGAAPLAVVSFGTCTGQPAAAGRLARILVGMGYRVVVAGGGQTAYLSHPNLDPRIRVCAYAPLSRLLPRAALLVCHGGQLSVFEALRNHVPVAVLPFQPEQAHNGLCLERLGCGRRLVRGCGFQGNPAVYLAALAARSDVDLAGELTGLVADPDGGARRAAVATVMAGYRGAEAVADLVLG